MGLKKMAKRENIDKRRLTQHETTTNIDIIEKYLSSNTRENILKGIIEFNPASKIRKGCYYNYRAALIGEVIFRSAQRSGVVHGIKKNEVVNAEIHTNSNTKIIVFEHKTGKLRPAVVFLEKTAATAFAKFLENILPQVDLEINDIKGPFFISYNGKKINHAGVQTSLNKLLTLTGIYKKITSTKSRIAASTFIAINNPAKTQIVADYMQHQASTADKYYRQMGGGDHLINGFEAIGQITKNK